jgi:hypothetical protein
VSPCFWRCRCLPRILCSGFAAIRQSDTKNSGVSDMRGRTARGRVANPALSAPRTGGLDRRSSRSAACRTRLREPHFRVHFEIPAHHDIGCRDARSSEQSLRPLTIVRNTLATAINRTPTFSVKLKDRTQSSSRAWKYGPHRALAPSLDLESEFCQIECSQEIDK